MSLPFEARLLFIGLFNFCDDHGFLWFESARIKMQVFPGDEVNVAELLDLLIQVGLLEWYFDSESRSEFLKIKNFEKHQKVDKPSKCKFPRESSRKLAIPNEVRRAVAKKYGCAPGGDVDATCFYCGEHGYIRWWKKQNGQPSGWVSTTLSYDHVTPEFEGGTFEPENLVLACNSCNKSKGVKEFYDFLLASAREASRIFPLDQGRDQGRDQGEEGIKDPSTGVNPAGNLPVPSKPKSDPSKNIPTWEAYREAYSRRYGTAPIRNASVNAKLAQFVNRIGTEESPLVAEFYLTHNDAFYVKSMHPVGLMLRDAEKLRTEWATGRKMLGSAAREAERVQHNVNVFTEAAARIAAREKRNG